MATELSAQDGDRHELKNIPSSPHQLPKRPSRSPSSKARITIKNRRKRYLDTHPDYFSSPSLELAGLPHTHNVMGYVTDGTKTLLPTIALFDASKAPANVKVRAAKRDTRAYWKQIYGVQKPRLAHWPTRITRP